MNKDKLQHYSYLTVTVIGAGILLYILVEHLFFVILPFLIAWAVAFTVRPLAHKISEKTHVSPKLVSAILTISFVVGGIAILVGALVYGVGQSWNFLSGLAEDDELYNILLKIMNPISGILGDSEGAAELEARIGDAVKNALTSVLSQILGALTAFASSVPRALIFLLVTVIGSVYFSLDLDNINMFLRERLPKKIFTNLVKFKNNFLSAVLKYLRSYLVIMSITFFVMLLGFLILKVKYAVLFAFIVSLLDALPLIGVGTVLVPWSVYQIVFGDIRLGIGIAVLFVVHVVIRQFCEPKIIGKNLGVHPIVSLILLYVGYCFFGFFGLLLIPILTVVVNILFGKNDPPEIKEPLVGK